MPSTATGSIGDMQKQRLRVGLSVVTAQVLFGESFRGNQSIVFFRADGGSSVLLNKLKQRNQVGTNELCTDGAANQVEKLGCTQRKILLDLDDVQPVAAAFSLYGENIVSATTVQTNLQFIGFHLPDVWDRGSQVILQ